MIVLEIPAVPHSLNKVLRQNWQRQRSYTKKWRKSVWAARCQKIVGRPTPLLRARITIERTSTHELDTDNLYASMKPILDALKCNELIVDDSPDHVDLIVLQKKGKASLRIQIEDASLPRGGCAAPKPATSHTCTSEPPGASTTSVDAR